MVQYLHFRILKFHEIPIESGDSGMTWPILTHLDPLVPHICQSSMDNSASLVSELVSCSSGAVPLCPRHFFVAIYEVRTIWDHKWMACFFRKKNLCFCRYFLAKFHVDADASQTGRVEFKDQADLARIEQQQLVNKIIRILGVTLKPLFSQPAQMEHQCWLVVLTILKNMSSSMGRMTSHIWNGK